MPAPVQRTPIRIARGDLAALRLHINSLEEGEIVWAQDLNQTFVVEVHGGSKILIPSVGPRGPGQLDLAGAVHPADPPPGTAMAGQAFVVTTGGTLHAGYGGGMGGRTVGVGDTLLLSPGGVWGVTVSPFHPPSGLIAGNGVTSLPTGEIDRIDSGVI